MIDNRGRQKNGLGFPTVTAPIFLKQKAPTYRVSANDNRIQNCKYGHKCNKSKFKNGSRDADYYTKYASSIDTGA
jgi:hypothetical protein